MPGSALTAGPLAIQNILKKLPSSIYPMNEIPAKCIEPDTSRNTLQHSIRTRKFLRHSVITNTETLTGNTAYLNPSYSHHSPRRFLIEPRPPVRPAAVSPGRPVDRLLQRPLQDTVFRHECLKLLFADGTPGGEGRYASAGGRFLAGCPSSKCMCARLAPPSPL